MEVCCYNRNNCSRHSVIIMRVMNIQKAYKPKYQPFNRGGNIKRKRMYKTVDSIDLQIEVTPLPFEEMADSRPGESSATIRERVIRARQIQEARYADIPGIYCNAQMNSKLLARHARPDDKGLAMLKTAMNRLNLSARAYDRILKVSRTIADLEGCELIQPAHLAEAIGYRNLDREDWAG